MPGALADQGGAAAETGHGHSGDQSLAVGEPAHTGGDGNDIGKAGANSGHQADADDGEGEVEVAERGQHPPAAEAQTAKDRAKARSEARQQGAGEQHGGGKDEIEQGEGQLHRSLQETGELADRSDIDRPGIGGAEADLHGYGGDKDAITLHGW